MRLRLLCIGRLGTRWVQEGVADYSQRITRYLPFATVELKEEKGGAAKGARGEIERLREGEGRRLLEKIPADAFVVVLDERGTALDSERLADLLGQHMLAGTPEVTMVIGGAYGLSATVRQRGDLILSLSAMTFPHQLARLLIVEQLYRALTILRHEPYHNR